MDNPTILYEAARLHYGEIRKESDSWRMANQANTNKPGLIRRIVVASETLSKKMIVRQKQVAHSSDEYLVLKTNA